MTEGVRVSFTEHRITEPLTLNGLRWLVDQCAGCPGDSPVMVKEYKSHSPLDWDPAQIIVKVSHLS